MQLALTPTLRHLAQFAKASVLAATVLLAGVANAQYEKGPDPTVSALERTGPFTVRTQTVSRTAASGFGGGTIHYPTATGTYGAIAVSPGFTAYESSIRWIGTRLASHGFVVITIDTNSRYDQPSARATQLLAALDWLNRTFGRPAATAAADRRVVLHVAGAESVLYVAIDGAFVGMGTDSRLPSEFDVTDLVQEGGTNALGATALGLVSANDFDAWVDPKRMTEPGD